MTNKNGFFERYPTLRVNAALYRLLLSWMGAALIYGLMTQVPFTEKGYYETIPFWGMVLLTLALWALLLCLKSTGAVVVLMLATCTLYCTLAVHQKQNIYFAFGCCIFLAALVVFSPLEEVRLPLGKKGLWGLVGALILVYTLWVGGICCLVYFNHWTPNYDFGIFSQMFYYMRKTGLPLVTCERDKLLSHFAVHISPICYALWPLYALLPSPLTLLFAQAFLVGSGAIPLVLICRQRRMEAAPTALLAGIYLAYPAFFGGCFYYFHENNFLTPLILWMFWAFEQKKPWRMLLTTVLVCMVKEDAPMYAAIISLYFFLLELKEKRPALYKPGVTPSRCWKKGKELISSVELWMFIFCVLVFVTEIGILNTYGNGAMTGRYGNYIYDGSGRLWIMFKSIFENPIHVICECFTDEKLLSIFEILVPLGFLPLLIQYWEELFLLIPFVLMNLMSEYYYQHILGYQYYFGSCAFLFYLAVVNYSRESRVGEVPCQDMSAHASLNRKKLLTTGFCCCLVLATCLFGYKLFDYFETYRKYEEQRSSISQVLDLVPEGVSVVSSGFFIPELSQRDEIYETDFTDEFGEYVVLDLRPGMHQEKYVEEYRSRGDYELVEEVKDCIILFRWNEEASELFSS